MGLIELLVGMLLMAIIGSMIFAPFGRSSQGLLLGLLRGPLGVILAIIQRSNWKEEAVRRQQYMEQRRLGEESFGIESIGQANTVRSMVGGRGDVHRRIRVGTYWIQTLHQERLS